MTISFPSSRDLSDALIEVLRMHPEGLSSAEIDQKVTVHLNLPSEVSTFIRSGNRTEIQYRLAWCRTKAKKQGKLEKSENGVWRILSL